MRRPALAVLALTMLALTGCSNQPVEPTPVAAPTSSGPSYTTTTSAPATPDELYLADFLDTPGLSSTMGDAELISLGRQVCDVMSYREYPREQLIAELGASKFGPVVMEVMVDAANLNLCPQYSFPSARAPAVAPPAPAEPEMTVSQGNALDQASSYLSYTAFSRTGLIDQLEYEGYTNDDATFAVDHVTVDWMVQAEKKAASYLDYTSFSRSGLIDQLEYEGFTSEQAEHGVDSVGL